MALPLNQHPKDRGGRAGGGGGVRRVLPLLPRQGQPVEEAAGGVPPCDFYVLDEYKLGSLKQNSFEEIHEKRKEIHFVEDSAIMHEDCKKCKYAPICRGGCRRHRVIADCQSPKNYFCESYYEFFSYSISRLEEIAAIYQKNY